VTQAHEYKSVGWNAWRY